MGLRPLIESNVNCNRRLCRMRVLRALGLQVRDATDIRQPDSLAGLTRNRQCVAGKHLDRDAKIVKCGQIGPCDGYFT